MSPIAIELNLLTSKKTSAFKINHTTH